MMRKENMNELDISTRETFVVTEMGMAREGKIVSKTEA